MSCCCESFMSAKTVCALCLCHWVNTNGKYIWNTFKKGGLAVAASLLPKLSIFEVKLRNWDTAVTLSPSLSLHVTLHYTTVKLQHNLQNSAMHITFTAFTFSKAPSSFHTVQPYRLNNLWTCDQFRFMTWFKAQLTEIFIFPKNYEAWFFFPFNHHWQPSFVGSNYQLLRCLLPPVWVEQNFISNNWCIQKCDLRKSIAECLFRSYVLFLLLILCVHVCLCYTKWLREREKERGWKRVTMSATQCQAAAL